MDSFSRIAGVLSNMEALDGTDGVFIFFEVHDCNLQCDPYFHLLIYCIDYLEHDLWGS